MLRSVLSKIASHRRLAVLAAAAALSAAAALALTGTVSAGAAATRTTRTCSNATLRGTYTYAYTGWTISAGKRTPATTAGFDTFNGAGASTGETTFIVNGVVLNNNSPDTSTYTINADCTGTVVFNVAGSLANFNVYLTPRGQSFTLIETDPGTVLAGSETRVSR